MSPTATNAESAPILRRPLKLLGGLNRFVEGFVPSECMSDPNRARRARLVAHFGVQGAIFGPAYAIFYLLIGHYWGAGIICVCSIVFAAIPSFLRRTGRLDRAGHILVGTMAAGFTQLTFVEGGMHGHAVAWLSSVPLCALLVLGHRRAVNWCFVCLAIAGVMAAATIGGVDLTPAYDPRWTSLVDSAGNVGLIVFLFALGLVFDVSRRRAFRQMQESRDELATSNEKLARLNNEKTEFLGIAAHDLRNPLSSIIGFAELLSLEPEQRVNEMARDISIGGRRMLTLINDLLDANAIEQGIHGSRIERCDLAALTQQCLGAHRPAAEAKRISVEFAADGPRWVHADRKATAQILDNLLSNAVKYSPLGGTVRVSIESQSEWCEWAVRDQGQGISAEDQARLFQKFTRLTARPTAGESSVGLGLSIVKRLAEAMRGSVACQSQPGQGATFSLRLPAA